MVYIGVALIIGLSLYLASRALIQSQRLDIAENIEKAALRDCSSVLTVEPETVPIYDVSYWSTINRASDEVNTHVTCFAPQDEWKCICEPSP